MCGIAHVVVGSCSKMKEGQNGLAKKGNGEIMTRQALVPRWQIESRVDGCIDGWMDGWVR